MNKKFDAIDYLVKKYVDDGEHATIPIILKDKKDFYNPYDPTGTTLSKDVYEYLDKCSDNIPLQYKIRINVVCDNVTDEDKERMEKALNNHYGVSVFNNNLNIKESNRKTLIIALLGLIVILFLSWGDTINAVGDFFNITRDVFREIVTITGWVFIWAALENLVFKKRKIIEKKNDNIQMFNAQMLFETKEEYYNKNKDLSYMKDEEIRESFTRQ